MLTNSTTLPDAALAELDRLTQRSDMDRFMAKVVPEPNSGCWLWVGSIMNRSYCGFWDKAAGRTVTASRWIYEKTTGLRLGSKEACHTCDVPCCVNPMHLFAGTHQENMRDAVNKGRFAFPPLSSLGYNSKKTHCKQGHLFNEDSVSVLASGVKQRRCAVCTEVSRKKYRLKVKARKGNG